MSREVLEQHRRRLRQLELEATVMYPEGHERHERAVVDRDELAALVKRLERAVAEEKPGTTSKHTRIKVDPWQ